MPQHEIHYNIDDLMIGRKFADVHQVMDILSGEGPNHRRMFHDNKTVSDILAATGSYEAAWASHYHLIADRLVRKGEPDPDLPDNVRKESIIAEMLDLMARGEVEIVVFPDSILTKLVNAIVTGGARLVDPTDIPVLRKQYYIKR
ncbi:MAG: hypothetical protein WC440_02620 [Candidatus Omnitrophota bacterium]|jgi:hypothetical protein